MMYTAKEEDLILDLSTSVDEPLIDAMVLQWKSKFFHQWSDALARIGEPQQAVLLLKAALRLIDSYECTVAPAERATFAWPMAEDWLEQLDGKANCPKLIRLCSLMVDCCGPLPPGEPRTLQVRAVISLLYRILPLLDSTIPDFSYMMYCYKFTLAQAHEHLEQFSPALDYYRSAGQQLAAAIRNLPPRSPVRYLRRAQSAALRCRVAGVYAQVRDVDNEGKFLLRAGQCYRSIFLKNKTDRNLALAVYECCIDILLWSKTNHVEYWRDLLEGAEAALLDEESGDFFYREKLASFYQWGLVDVERSQALTEWLLKRNPESPAYCTLLDNIHYLRNNPPTGQISRRKTL